jgi:hypothetical protein
MIFEQGVQKDWKKYHYLPTPVLSGSGEKGMISARWAPLTELSKQTAKIGNYYDI